MISSLRVFDLNTSASVECAEGERIRKKVILQRDGGIYDNYLEVNYDVLSNFNNLL